MADLAIKVLEGKDEKIRHTAQEIVDYKMLKVSDTPTNPTDVATVAMVQSAVSGGSGVIGTPTDGTYEDGLFAFTGSTKVADAVDGINETLAKLAPAKPVNLSSKTLALASYYSASEAGTGTVHSVISDSLRPQTSTVATFWDGDAGTISAEIDSVETSSRTLTTGNDAGTYSALVITADADPYVGQSGKENFWKALSAYILPTSDLSLASHTYRMKHSLTGNTNVLTFYVDNPATATIANQLLSFAASTSHYVSGVPTLDAGTTFAASFDVNNAVGKHYHTTKIADITGTNISTVNIAPASAYAENATISLSNVAVTVSNGTYTENASITFRGYNSKGVAGTSANTATGARIDTVSNESSRKVSGSGQFPTTGYGGSYDSTTSLKTTYAEELQMLNGRYQVPTGNYSTNLPVNGPDYSTGMGSGDRWVTFQTNTLSNNSAFTLTLNGTQGTFSGVATAGIKIYAKVEGVTGWIDCNAAYPGTGSPSADGDAAMVFGSSTATSKRVTFGSTPRSGQLYIRIGLPAGSNKQFQSISVGSIV